MCNEYGPTAQMDSRQFSSLLSCSVLNNQQILQCVRWLGNITVIQQRAHRAAARFLTGVGGVPIKSHCPPQTSLKSHQNASPGLIDFRATGAYVLEGIRCQAAWRFHSSDRSVSVHQRKESLRELVFVEMLREL